MAFYERRGGRRGPMTEADLARLAALEGQKRLSSDEMGEVRVMQVCKQPTYSVERRIESLLSRATTQQKADEARSRKQARRDRAAKRRQEQDDGYVDLLDPDTAKPTPVLSPEQVEALRGRGAGARW